MYALASPPLIKLPANASWEQEMMSQVLESLLPFWKTRMDLLPLTLAFGHLGSETKNGRFFFFFLSPLSTFQGDEHEEINIF